MRSNRKPSAVIAMGQLGQWMDGVTWIKRKRKKGCVAVVKMMMVLRDDGDDKEDGDDDAK